MRPFMLTVAAAAALAIGSLSASDAEARGCYRGGYGYGGYGVGYGVGYGGVGYGYPAYRGGFYGPSRNVTLYRGSVGYHPGYYYGPRRGGVAFSIGF